MLHINDLTSNCRTEKKVSNNPAATLFCGACFMHMSFGEFADYIYKMRHHKVGRYPLRRIK